MADRNAYLDFAAHLSDATTEKPDLDRLRWQGIPVRDAPVVLWEPIFVRSVDKTVATEAFFETVAARANRGLAFDPFVRDYSMKFRREGQPVEAIIYRRIDSLDHGDLFDVMGVGGLVPDDAVAFDDGVAARQPAHGPVSVALGLIDDSIPLLNARFRDAAGASRIVGFDAQSWGAPSTVLGKAEIGGWLARLQDEGEDVLYRELAALLFPALTRHSLRSRGSHGAHMLDLAGGTDHSGADPLGHVPLRVVQLPPVVYDDTSGVKMPLQVILGLQWLIDQTVGSAEALVVNISLGVLAGPKDGGSLLEQLIVKEIANAAAHALKLVVVHPYGNDYASQLVARRTLAPGDQAEFLLRVQPDDLTPSYVELRASSLRPGTDLGKLKVGLRAPSGDELAPQTFLPDTFRDLTDAAGEDIARVYHDVTPSLLPKPIPPYILIALRPTKGLTAAQPTSPSGAWAIRVENAGTEPMDFLLQVQSDDSPYPRRTGARQSYLDAPSVHEFDPRTRSYHLHAPGDVTHGGTNSAYTTIDSAAAMTAGGAVVRRDPLQAPPVRLAPADYTSEGADWSGNAPLASAVSGHGRSPAGVRAAGVHSHATVRLDGTSAAAATLTRDTVLRLMGETPLPGAAIAGPLPVSRLGGRVVLDNPAIRKRSL